MSDGGRTETGPHAASWSPGVVLPCVQIALGIGVVSLGLSRQDPLALLLTGLAALILIPTGASHLLRRPRLEVVDGQLAIARLRGPEFVPLASVLEVRALGIARWGARQHLMRLEYVDNQGREQLEVFTRTDLGTDPRDVVDTLTRLGFPGRPAEG